MFDTMLRALMPEDHASARALVASHFDGSRYEARLIEQLDAALRFDDPEYLAIIAWSGETPTGLAMFGTVAGAAGVVKLHAVMAIDDETCAALVTAIVAVSADSSERMLVAEVPEDAPWSMCTEALLANGFVEEGRVPDLIDDGISMRLMVHRG